MFNKVCKLKRKEFIKERRKHVENPCNDILASDRKRAAKDFKKAVRLSEKKFRQNITKYIREMKIKEPNAYWEMMEQIKLVSRINNMPDCNKFLEMFRNMGTAKVVGDVTPDMTLS